MKYKSTINKLKLEIDKLLIIHYSCESLDDNNKGYSPRITSIAVQHLQSESNHSFSLHIIAEEEKIDFEDIELHYNFLEEKMLEQFYDFVRKHLKYNWLHWKMKDISYGFEAIEHRYKILSGKNAPTISENKRFNLSSLMQEKYGENYVERPRMKNLMKLNGENSSNFLYGKEEVDAFKNKKYFELHQSTLCKVSWFGEMFLKMIDGKVKIQHSNIPNKINEWSESSIAKVLGFVAVIITLWTGFEFLMEKYSKQKDNKASVVIEYKINIF